MIGCVDREGVNYLGGVCTSREGMLNGSDDRLC